MPKQPEPQPTETPAPKKTRTRKPPSLFAQADAFQRELTELDERISRAHKKLSEAFSARSKLIDSASPEVIRLVEANGTKVKPEAKPVTAAVA